MLKSLSEMFLRRSMKLPLQSTYFGSYPDARDILSGGDKKVDTTPVVLPVRKEPEMIGFLVSSFRGTLVSLRNFLSLNREELAGKKFYVDFFTDVVRTLEKGIPIVHKQHPTNNELLELKNIQTSLVRMFKVLSGVGFFENPGFEDFFNRFSLLGPHLHSYLVRNLHDQAPTTNPWKEFDPTWEV